MYVHDEVLWNSCKPLPQLPLPLSKPAQLPPFADYVPLTLIVIWTLFSLMPLELGEA